ALRDATVEAEFPVIPGGQYRLTLNTRRDPAATNAPAVDLYLNDALETPLPAFEVWDGFGYQFVAVDNTLRVRLQPTVVSPGTNGFPATVWLDTVRLEEFGRQQTFLPEEPTRPLLGRPGAGEWRLEVTDARGMQVGRLDSWQLRLTFAPTNPPVVRLTNMVPAFGEVPPAEFKYFLVEVPLEARAATNYLFATDGPLDLWYSETGLPDGTQVGDVPAPQLPWVINTNVPPVLPRGQRYYLGVRNPDPAQTRRFEIRVDFDLAIIPLTNNVPYARTNLVAGLLDYYAFDVSRDATAVEFALTNLTGDANLFVTRGPRLPRPLRYDYAGTNTGTLPELVRIDLASEPVPLDAGRWYLAVAGVSTNPMNYTVLAREVPGQFLRINDGVTNRVTNAVAGGFDYFVIDVPADAERATVRVRPVAGDADLFVKKGVPLPDEFRYDYASAKPDLAEEVVAIDPFSDPMPLRPGRWFAGVQAVGPVPVVYDISVNFVRPAIEDLQNGVPVVRTNFGAAFRHFRLAVPPGAVEARFEVYDILNEADLLVARDALPTNAPRVFSSFLPTTNAESIRLTNTQASLPGDWYLSVVTSNTAPNIYTVRASFLTNPVIPPGTNVTLRILPPVAPSTNGVLEWDSVVGRRYQVEYADAFHAGATVWTALGTPVTAVATVTRVEVPFPDPFRLYRVIDLGGVTPPPPPPPATNLVSLLTLLPDGTNALLAWNSVPARQYQVQFSTDPFVASPVWT
ncbi:MAG: pre-peptidase C-terminal domain-containing protein, partial [Verrucomicrobiota bacterium]